MRSPGGVDYTGNELASAQIVGGAGGNASQGNAGAGGNLSGLNLGVQSVALKTVNGTFIIDGWLQAIGGAGGNSTNGLGGVGGAVGKSTLASADGDPNLNFGILVNGGFGGDGSSGGGAGGGIKKLTVNPPSETDLYAAVIAAGNGGDATVAGVGGDGGAIKGVVQSKDVNSAITAILGGNGGAGAGAAGGTGGSVRGVNSVGFIGLPADDATNLGVFDMGITAPAISAMFAGGNVSQGIFAGRGADGAANGSVSNIVARQIAAIGAVVDENGLFGVATAVTNVTADLIGYEVVRDNVFESTAAGDVSPSTAVPVDGFILAGTVSGIDTLDNDRTAAFTFNG